MQHLSNFKLKFEVSIFFKLLANILKKDSSLNKNNSNIEGLSNNTLPVLYAQPKENGYQLVNAKPEVVFIILKTNSKDRFIIKNKNGNLTKTNGVWVAEFYEDSILKVKKYQIKF